LVWVCHAVSTSRKWILKVGLEVASSTAMYAP
jgi:hypothetical protein